MNLSDKILNYKEKYFANSNLKIDDIGILIIGAIKENNDVNIDELYELAHNYYQQLKNKPYGSELTKHTYNEMINTFKYLSFI